MPCSTNHELSCGASSSRTRTSPLAGVRVRLRYEGSRITLTYKQAAAGVSAIDSIREAEVEVSDFGEAYRLLVALGFRARQDQENRREEWRLGEVRFDFDTWPGLDTFLEIEGPDQAAVEGAAALLGLDMAAASYGSVDEVYAKVLGRDILAESSLTFAGQARFVWHDGAPAPDGMPSPRSTCGPWIPPTAGS